MFLALSTAPWPTNKERRKQGSGRGCHKAMGLHVPLPFPRPLPLFISLYCLNAVARPVGYHLQLECAGSGNVRYLGQCTRQCAGLRDRAWPSARLFLSRDGFAAWPSLWVSVTLQVPQSWQAIGGGWNETQAHAARVGEKEGTPLAATSLSFWWASRFLLTFAEVDQSPSPQRPVSSSSTISTFRAALHPVPSILGNMRFLAILNDALAVYGAWGLKSLWSSSPEKTIDHVSVRELASSPFCLARLGLC
jgi:hypothetical protein